MYLAVSDIKYIRKENMYISMYKNNNNQTHGLQQLINSAFQLINSAFP